ncbi:hypothetical protein Agub_g5666 [Astrephomene gubernaculifera]|uniref:Uncharacterized protein n=1 Tax=Astrephomene gubernaculifera TaxID=47775 RepID=A0AAD3DPU5_9CHLO|nr:hypothetical protein Agub_g5666 [Astrephomene gubernaculifera]
MENNSQVPSFADVLPKLSMPALEIFYNYLKGEYIAGNARLAFRALRTAHDDCVRQLEPSLGRNFKRLWRMGWMPSLKPWPCCEAISLGLRLLDNNAGPAGVAALVALQFTRSPLEIRQRIKRVNVSWEMDDLHVDLQPAVAQLPLFLPALRQLDLSNALPLLHNPSLLQQQLMYAALSTLPHLEQLALPGYAALRGVSGLAACSSLVSLSVLRVACLDPESDADPDRGNRLTAAYIHELSKLTRLQELHLSGCILSGEGEVKDKNEEAEDASRSSKMLRLLLDRLAPSSSLRHLRLEDCMYAYGEYETADAHLDAGRIQIVRLGFVKTKFLTRHLHRWSLARPPQQQQLKPRLQIQELYIDSSPLSGPQLARSRQVLRQNFSATVEVQCMAFDRTSLDAVLQAVELLGRPQQLKLRVAGPAFTLESTAVAEEPSSSHHEPPGGGSMRELGPAAAAGGCLQQLPSAGDLMRIAVAQAAAAGQVRGSAADSSGSWDAHLLWASGPLLAPMLQQGQRAGGQHEGGSRQRDEEPLQLWMRRLNERAVQVAGGGSERCVTRYQELPAADAVVVQCMGRAGAEAVEAAVKALAVEVGTTGAAAAGVEAAAAGLQVLRLRSESELETFCNKSVCGLDGVFAALHPAVRQAWDGAWEPSACGIGLRRLEWLLALGEQLDFPEVEFLLG